MFVVCVCVCVNILCGSQLINLCDCVCVCACLTYSATNKRVEKFALHMVTICAGSSAIGQNWYSIIPGEKRSG